MKSGAGRKRKQEVNNGETEEPESKKAATLQNQQTETDQAASQQLQPEGQVTKTESRVPDNSSADNVQPADRNVSCIAGIVSSCYNLSGRSTLYSTYGQKSEFFTPPPCTDYDVIVTVYNLIYQVRFGLIRPPPP